jgi:hypothetical protein
MPKAKYFMNCRTAEEVKKEYFRLAMIHHPDRGGNLETMQEINNEYDCIWPLLKDKHVDKEGKEYRSNKETSETAAQYPEVINKIIHFVGVKIEICGSWVWLSGNTRTYKEEIKAAGFHWSQPKTMWYWRAEENRAWFNKKSHDMDYIRVRYGSETIENEPFSAIA